jgi:cytidyltransferase-like protein
MRKIGYCSVCADILHLGHIRFIQECMKLCDYLIVGVMTDEAIEKYKGQKPIIPYGERSEIVSQIKGVYLVVKQEDFSYNCVDPTLGIEVFIDSEEHRREPANIFIRRTDGISSTQIKERIIERLKAKT